MVLTISPVRKKFTLAISGHFRHNPTMMKTQSIRELKALQAEALAKYHAEYARLEAEIQSIRQARGTVLKAKPFEEYYEPGRSRMPVPSMGQGQ